MMGQLRWRGTWGKFWRFLGLTASMAVLLFLFAFLGAESSSPVQVGPAEGDILLLEDREDVCCLVFQTATGTRLQVLDAAGSGILYQENLDCSLQWAALRDGTLYLLEQQDTGLTLSQWNLQLERTDVWPLPVASDGVSLSVCDSMGRFYYVDPSHPSALWSVGPHETQGVQVEYPGSGSIQFLAGTSQGTLYLMAGGKLWRTSDPSLGSWTSASATFAPLYLLGEQCYVDLLGRLYRWEEGASPQLETSGLGKDRLLAALDREEHLLVPGSDGTLQCCSLSGGVLESVSVFGEPQALCGSGILSQEGGYYWFTSARFYQTPPTLSPSPSVSADHTPSPTPSLGPSLNPSFSPSVAPSPGLSPQPTDLFSEEGDLLVTNAGTTVDDLIQWLIPESVLIQRPDGETVTSGSLATGMTAGEYTLVVLGDCDGTGSVTKLDLRQGQLFLLDEETGTHPQRRAADLDGDGSLTTVDLVLLSQLIS